MLASLNVSVANDPPHFSLKFAESIANAWKGRGDGGREAGRRMRRHVSCFSSERGRTDIYCMQHYDISPQLYYSQRYRIVFTIPVYREIYLLEAQPTADCPIRFSFLLRHTPLQWRPNKTQPTSYRLSGVLTPYDAAQEWQGFPCPPPRRTSALKFHFALPERHFFMRANRRSLVRVCGATAMQTIRFGQTRAATYCIQ